MSSWIEKVIERAESNHQIVITPFTTLNSCSFIYLKCKCGNIKSYVVKDFLRRNCKECANNLLKVKFDSIDEAILPQKLEGEKWELVKGGVVSNLGRACNNFGKLLQLDEKYRWHLDGKMQYASIVLAKAFKIENYETLETTTNIVRFKDKNNSNILIENLYIGTRNEVGKEYGLKNKSRSAQSDLDINEIIDNCEVKKIEEFPNYLIFDNGSVWSIKSFDPLVGRFLVFSSSDTNSKSYYRFTGPNNISIYVHRLICIAFYPIEGKSKYEDYKDLQVNHKDGNTLNNCKSNLEWVTKEANIQHAYDTGLNKKVQGVIQFEKKENGDKGEKLDDFMSIAKASRETGVPEHEIRNVAQGKSKGKFPFLWEFKDVGKAKEYSKKFSCK
jgi:hypothetical protein